MLPAQQGLETQKQTTLHVRFWLVIEEKLIALQCLAQTVAHGEMHERRMAHVGGIVLVAVLAVFLGMVHGSVGAA